MSTAAVKLTHSSLHVKCPIYLFDLNKFGFSLLFFIEVPGIKFLRNSSSGSRNDACRQTDGHDEGNRSFSRVRERA